jgi:zinc protease
MSGPKWLIELDRGSSLVHLKLIFKVGSLWDPDGACGLAHLTARSLLRGTKKRNYLQLNEAIEQLGGSISVFVDQTSSLFECVVLRKNLNPFLEILTEILTLPRFDSTEIELLKNTIFGELASDLQDPRAMAVRAMILHGYSGTRLRGPNKGTQASLQTLNTSDVIKFYQTYLNSDRLLIAVSSSDDTALIQEKLRAPSSSLPAQDLVNHPFPNPSFRGKRGMVVDQKEMATLPVLVALPGISDSDPDALSLEVANFAFGEQFTSRLMQVLRVKEGWTYGVSSGFQQFFRPQAEAGCFSIYLFPSEEFAELALAKSLEMLSDWVSRGITSEEFSFARESMLRQYPFQWDTAEKRLEWKIRSVLTGRKMDSLEEYRCKLEALHLDSINQVIQRRVSLDHFMVSMVGDAQLWVNRLKKILNTQQVETVEVNP